MMGLLLLDLATLAAIALDAAANITLAMAAVTGIAIVAAVASRTASVRFGFFLLAFCSLTLSRLFALL